MEKLYTYTNFANKNYFIYKNEIYLNHYNKTLKHQF